MAGNRKGRDLRGARMIVTGASRGIGGAVAVAAASRGASVGLVARTRGDLDAVAGEVRSAGGRAAVAVADVGDPASIGEAVAALESELGATDVVVANAGIGAYGPFVDVEQAEMDRLVRVNVLGTMHTLQAVLPGMIERRSGDVVVMGSIAGRMGAPYEALYSATKFAQVGLAEALSVELSAFGISVAVVNPGPVETGFFEERGHPYDRPRPRPVPASAVADAVIAAVERRKPEQFVPGWLRQAQVVRHLVPSLYRVGARRAFRSELAASARGQAD